jgi:hypothetical protein
MRKIVRSGYVARRKGRLIRVGPTMIRNFGLIGKGPRIIPVRSTGALTMFGYSPKVSSPTRRRKALMAAVRAGQKPLTVFHRLNAISKLYKRTQPVYARRTRVNGKWVLRTFI